MTLIANAQKVREAEDARNLAEARSAEAAAALAIAEKKIADLNAEIAAIRLERDALRASLDEAGEKLVLASAEMAAMRRKIESSREEIEKAASERAAATVASLGHRPVPVQPDNPPSGSATRQQFNQMSPAARMQFIRSGGRITD